MLLEPVCEASDPVELSGGTQNFAGLLERNFPFYFILDSHFKLSRYGCKLKKLVHDVCIGSDFFSLFDTRRVAVAKDFAAWSALAGTRLSLYPKAIPDLEFRGQLEMMEGRLLFLITPLPAGPSALRALGLSPDDFPAHSLIGDLLFANHNHAFLARQANQLNDELIRLRELYDGAGFGLLLSDQNGRIVIVNRRLRFLLNLPDCNWAGVRLSQLDAHVSTLTNSESCPVLKHPGSKENERALEVENPTIWQRQEVKLSDGRLLRIASQPMPDGGWAFYFSDVTNEVNALKRSSDSLGAVAQSMRSPLLRLLKSAHQLLDYSLDCPTQVGHIAKRVREDAQCLGVLASQLNAPPMSSSCMPGNADPVTAKQI